MPDKKPDRRPIKAKPLRRTRGLQLGGGASAVVLALVAAIQPLLDDKIDPTVILGLLLAAAIIVLATAIVGAGDAIARAYATAGPRAGRGSADEDGPASDPVVVELVLRSEGNGKVDFSSAETSQGSKQIEVRNG